MDAALRWSMLGVDGRASTGAARVVPELEARARHDRTALEALLRAEGGAIAHVCHAMSPQGEGRDATQETFEKLVRHIGRFDPARGPFRTWAFQVARNVCRDRHRRRRPSSPEDVEALAADLPDPERALAASGEAGRVAAALATLPENMRRALLLFHLEGRSYEAIAAELGVPKGTVMTWLHRGRRRLRALVEGAEGSP